MGNVLMGVHTFETLNVVGNAWLEVGSDRVKLIDQPGSSVSAGSTLRIGELDPSNTPWSVSGTLTIAP